MQQLLVGQAYVDCELAEALLLTLFGPSMVQCWQQQYTWCVYCLLGG